MDSARISPLLDLPSRAVRRLCLIKPSALGDVVQTLPLLGVLKERFPQARLSWVVQGEFADLLEDHPDLDEIIRFQRRGGVRAWWSLLRGLRGRKFDLVFDLQGLLRSGLMSLATGAPLRVGLQNAREGAAWAAHLALPDSGPLVPAHLRYWRVAEALGLGDRRSDARLRISPRHQFWAQKRLRRLGRPLLAVHPGGRWVTKRWPVEHFAVVVARGVRRFGFSVVLVGSAAEIPIAGRLELLLQRFLPQGACLNLAGLTGLKQLAAVLQLADVLLTNDSGPMHLAAALNTPVLGIFTATDPGVSGPPGEQHERVTTALPCRSCYHKRCPQRGGKHLACLQEISPQRVWRALERLVVRQAQRPAA